MTAHCLTFLYQTLGKYWIRELTNQTLGSHKYELTNAQLGDNFEQEDWERLMATKGVEDFIDVVVEILSFYRNRWKEIGCPTTAESWQERKWWTPEQARVYLATEKNIKDARYWWNETLSFNEMKQFFKKYYPSMPQEHFHMLDDLHIVYIWKLENKA